jgi:hypothetical protein
VWADTFLHAEQQHLLRLLLWAGLSIVGATSVGAMMVMRRTLSPFLAHFAIQMAVWGAVVGAIAAIELYTSHLRDLSGAARLERLLWMNVGLDVGFVATGAVLAIYAWAAAKRSAGIGAGTGIVIQGVALLVIDLQYASMISR